jgi:hypothetical protein
MPRHTLIKSMFTIAHKAPLPARIYRQCIKGCLPVLFILMLGGKTQAQEMNLAGYDHTNMHFGFIIAINSTNFVVQPISNLGGHFQDSLKTIYSNPQTGFNLGIVSEVKIGPYLKIRFVPDLSFAERDLAYTFEGKVDSFTVTKKVESTFLDFPIDVKLISKRLTNFQVYVLAGAKYITDLASQTGVNQQLAGVNATVRIIRNDYAYEAGAGLQFFLPYFKFGIELKMSQGIRNLFIKDNTVYTQSLESLTSQVFLVSFTFEG